jgi:hypothetical protein
LRKPILCIDFDGTIHSYVSGWQGAEIIPDPPTPGAIEFLWEAIRIFEVHIYSSRSHQPGGIRAIREWLDRWDEAYWSKQRTRPRSGLVMNVKFPECKPSALVTIDDRAITFDGTWPDVATLRNFKPWNKRDV